MPDNAMNIVYTLPNWENYVLNKGVTAICPGHRSAMAIWSCYNICKRKRGMCDRILQKKIYGSRLFDQAIKQASRLKRSRPIFVFITIINAGIGHIETTIPVICCMQKKKVWWNAHGSMRQDLVLSNQIAERCYDVPKKDSDAPPCTLHSIV